MSGTKTDKQTRFGSIDRKEMKPDTRCNEMGEQETVGNYVRKETNGNENKCNNAVKCAIKQNRDEIK
jgi:hypothetical protein